MRPQVCISNTKTPSLQFKYWDPRSAVQILRPQVYISITETSGLQFKYWGPTGTEVLSQLKTIEKWKEKWKWNFGSLLTPQLAAGSESERKYLLLLWWKVQKSAMKMWAVATPHSRWTTWICLPTSCGCCQGDLGEAGLDLHLIWHSGNNHWNNISSVVSILSRILGPADQNIPPNWRIQSYSPD